MPPSSNRLADRDAREAIRTNLDDTLFVEAAAGTGKTTALVGRIVEVIRRGRGSLEDIVAVTFTEKAAGEMKLRLRADLERARIDALDDGGASSEEAAHLERALRQLELAHIGTIHGFCADLLKERPIEAGVDPSFRVAAEDEASRLLDAAFERWFQAALADPPPGVRRALRRSYSRNAGGPRGALRSAAERLSDHRDFDASWTRPTFERAAELDRAVELIRELAVFAPLAAKPDDWLTRHFRHLERWLHELETRERVHGRDLDGLEARLKSLVRDRRAGWHRVGYRDRLFGRDLLKEDVRARRDEVKAELDAIVERADADLAALLREELRPVIAAYEELKRLEGRLDFVDLLLRTRDLLRDDHAVRRDYQRRFRRFFVDEFQDTDPLQVEILLLLAASDPEASDPATVTPQRGKLFLVGDPKQSIYRFRRADVMLYERTKRRLERAGAVVLRLTTSFRAQPRIQDAVNGAFSPRMTGSEDGSQADYVPLAAFRDNAEDQPAIIALPVPEPYGRWGSVYKGSVEASLPVAVGALVDWIVRESGWRVTERDRPDERVPIEPRHVCLLFRRLQNWGDDVTRPYVRALEAREIPHVLVGGRSYFDREEVLAVRNALTAIEWPDDTLSVYAALRGPLFSLGDGTLLHFTTAVGSLHPLVPHGRFADRDAVTAIAPELAAVSDALEILGELHRRRNRRPLPETILRLFAAVRAHAGIAIWPTGEQALANVLRVVDRARAFEKTGAPSFRAFLDRMEDEADRGQAEEAPIVEEGTDGVRMMTVHKAKGLEFPVVVLADITCNATFEPPTRHVNTERRLWAESLCSAAPLDLLENVDVEREREMAEADRLSYVAATRARDLLVVPALADGRDGEGGFPEPGASSPTDREWWLDSLRPALYPPVEMRREPAGDAAGCPPFEKDAIVSRPDRDGRERPTPAASVAPGLHRSEAGTEVVWWDANALDLAVDAPTGRRQQRLLEVDREAQPTLSVEEGIAAHDAWQTERARRLAAGSRPEIVARTVKAIATEAAEAGESLPGRVEWIEVPRPAEEGSEGEGRPGGSRFGTLVHAALASAPLDADTDTVASIVKAHGAGLGAPRSEIDAAVVLVARALAHEVLRRAARAERTASGFVRREIPVHAPRPEGSILEGVADLVFRDAEGAPGEASWIVVDYKTDRAISFARDIYEHQVARYARSIASATGEPARGVVLVL